MRTSSEVDIVTTNRSPSISSTIPQPRFALRLTLPPALGAPLPHCFDFAYFLQLPPLHFFSI